MSQPGTLVWLASHELRLGWRDWIAMMTAGRRNRARNLAIALIIFAGFMHLLAYSMVGRYAGARIGPDKATLVVVTGVMLLSLSLLLSQAMELVTRVFYSRSDLDLILTSPVSPQKIFSVRIGRIAVEVALFAMLLAMPSINVLAVLGGARWLFAYGVVAAMGAVATAFAVALTVALFRTIGAKRTRLIAQIVAAVIGAAFVIGLQIAAIFSYGSLSLAPLQSAWLIAHVPNIDSPVWWPARAMLGDPAALIRGRGDQHRAARRGDPDFRGPVRRSCGGRRRRVAGHRPPTPLVESVSPPLREPHAAAKGVDPARARSLADVADSDADPLSAAAGAISVAHFSQPHRRAYVLLVPMMVMAAGHLGGNLAWLSISGEDAPDLVATAPISARRIIWAKIEAVMGAIAFIFAPLVAVLAFASVRAGAGGGCGRLVAAASATLIQLCFRTQARRSQFRHRHVSHRASRLLRKRFRRSPGPRPRRWPRPVSGARAVPGDHCYRHFMRRPADRPARYSGIRRAIALTCRGTTPAAPRPVELSKVSIAKMDARSV